MCVSNQHHTSGVEMKWGEYLAKGILTKSLLKISSEDPTLSSNSSSDNHCHEIIQLVEKYFQQEGATIFSSKIAVGYLQVSHPPPPLPFNTLFQLH